MDKLFTESTHFTRDAQGRYICNTFDEAVESTKKTERVDGQHRPDARPFDIVIIGGGTFGAVEAHKLFSNDKLRRHRILVLEGGPFLVPEHTQNMPDIGLGNGDKTHLATLIQLGKKARNGDQQAQDELRDISKEVWGLPWHSKHKFPGLAYCLAGRSLYWGGWSPQLLDEEMTAAWPSSVVAELKNQYFREASDQIGTTSTNDYVFGDLQKAWREQLAGGYNTIRHAISLEELPNHPGVMYADGAVTRNQLLEMLDLKSSELSDDELKDLLKLEAPLAVQSKPVRSGTFPINKFSAMPLLIQAARHAQSDSGGDDVRKRLMVVPNCHVIRMHHSGDRVTTIETSNGDIQLPDNGKVIIALGTVESARLAKVSFGDLAGQDQIGQNLMAHLRSNIHLRVPRAAISEALASELQAAGLFVKCRFQYPGTNKAGTFHLQLTAAGRGLEGQRYSEELNRTIPDLDTLEVFEQATDSTIVITVRGIGEMTPDNPDSHVTLDQNPAQVDEYGVRRGYVSLKPSSMDLDLWNAMDDASNDVAEIFINGHHFDLLNLGENGRNLPPNTKLKDVLPYVLSDNKNNPKRRDGMGTTHHEAGTLRMGTVTDSNGRFHNLSNAYAVGPALFPTIGSPNPMLTGVAMCRQLADHLIPPHLTPPPASGGLPPLLDSNEATRSLWDFVGVGNMHIEESTLFLTGKSGELGFAYPQAPLGENFRLVCDFMIGSKLTNSGVFFGSWDPNRPVPDRNDPSRAYAYENRAWVPVHTGFEVQIDELAQPDGQDKHRTGAIYDIPVGIGAGRQQYDRGPELVPGHWHHLEIVVEGNYIRVLIDNSQTSNFTNNDHYRGRASDPGNDVFGGFVGFQAHTGTIAFANIAVDTECGGITQETNLKIRKQAAVIAGKS